MKILSAERHISEMEISSASDPEALVQDAVLATAASAKQVFVDRLGVMIAVVHRATTNSLEVHVSLPDWRSVLVDVVEHAAQFISTTMDAEIKKHREDTDTEPLFTPEQIELYENMLTNARFLLLTYPEVEDSPDPDLLGVLAGELTQTARA